MEKLTNGDLSVRADIKTHDEVCLLAQYFNKMANVIETKNAKINEHNEALEDLVKKRTSDLEKANTELKKLLSMKEYFLTVASHDIKTPFTAILNASQFLLKDYHLEEEPRQWLEIIYNSAKGQLNYVNQMLEVVMGEDGFIKLNPKYVCIDSLIENSFSNLKILANKKKIKFIKDIHCTKKVYIDKDKMQQVINNLISNSIKFTPEKGKITIRCFLNKKNEVEFHVIDNGIGIPVNEQKHVFSKYSNLQKAGTKGETGNGLGLYICKNVIELHGGKIFFKSKKSKGSDFYFTIPIK